MLDFRKYFNLNSNGDYFDSMMNEIIAKNTEGKNENTINVSKEALELKEASDFKEFKSLVEKYIKLYIFNDVNEVLGEWKRRNYLKINGLEERGTIYNLQNYANDEFKTYYRTYKRASEYFANDYNTLTTSEICEELKQMESIYRSVNKYESFTDNDFLLELLVEFQESTKNNDIHDKIRNFKDELTSEEKEWDFLEDNGNETLKTNNTIKKIELYEKWRESKIARNKLKPWDIAKRKQIKKEIDNIRKELQDIEILEKIENLNPTVIEGIIKEVNDSQMESQSSTSDDDMNNYFDEHANKHKQSPTL